MSLRINHNIASINGHRNMNRNDMMISKSLEKLSSGLRINRAADDAAGLVISEQMRAQITGLNQAIDNSETAVAMVQTAEGALDEINALLNKSRELVLHAANEGTNDTNQLLADQKELDNAINSITRIAEQTQFGTKKLLDGSLAGAQNYDATKVHKFDVGTDLMARADFFGDSEVSLNVGTAGTATVLSGFAGSISADVASIGNYLASGGSAFAFTTAGSTVSTVEAFFSNAANSLAEGAAVTIVVGGESFRFENQESVGDIVSQVNAAQDDYTLSTQATGLRATRDDLGVGGLESDVSVTANSGYKTSSTEAAAAGTSSVSDTGAKAAGAQTVATLSGLKIGGSDVTVNLVADLQDASILRANAYGIEIDTTNSFSSATGTTTFTMTKGALFQVGANAEQQVAVDLKGVKATQLGLGGDSRSTGRIESLFSVVARQSIVNGDFTGALEVIDKAIDDVTNLRGQLGAFQSNTLESGLNSLRVAQENLTAAESTIRDVDFAAESARFTRNNIMIQASTAMLAQANQLPQNVLQLLG